jgi:hypothetical protein
LIDLVLVCFHIFLLQRNYIFCQLWDLIWRNFFFCCCCFWIKK